MVPSQEDQKAVKNENESKLTAEQREGDAVRTFKTSNQKTDADPAHPETGVSEQEKANKEAQRRKEAAGVDANGKELPTRQDGDSISSADLQAPKE